MSTAPKQYVIMASDRDVAALYEMFEITRTTDFFRGYFESVLDKLIEYCSFLDLTLEDVDGYINYLTMYLPDELHNRAWNIYLVDTHGAVDTTDRRSDTRTLHQIVKSLACDIRRQLIDLKLYDEYGVLYYEHDQYVTSFNSWEIRLRRINDK